MTARVGLGGGSSAAVRAPATVDPDTLCAWIDDARETTFALVADLSDEQLMGPRLEIVNPLLWELGHLAWFQERFVLRERAARKPLRADADALWNSSTVAHDARWELPLPSREETLAYMAAVRDRVIEEVRRPDASEQLHHLALYTVLHEDMHGEAIAYTRQTHAWPAPPAAAAHGDGERSATAPTATHRQRDREEGPVSRDVEVPGGELALGARPGEGFVFDNERWAHPVRVEPFAIARTAVTQAELAAFVDEGGYRRRELWSEEGWLWRERMDAERPLYWRSDGAGGWERRVYDRWLGLELDLPAIHLCWYEADALARWAGRRLPTEAEWELAAAGDPQRKRRHPWGEEPPTPDRARLDLRGGGPLAVDGLPAGDSLHGVRQLTGNVWEWTSTTFEPYPGFEPDAYEDNSRPWFGSRKVLRGGAWATRSRMVRNTLRNYFTPDRRDVWAGVRTCAR